MRDIMQGSNRSPARSLVDQLMNERNCGPDNRSTHRKFLSHQTDSSQIRYGEIVDCGPDNRSTH
jgi:hypothetical protein